MKISEQVARDNPKLIEAVFWSSFLDNVFKENLKDDPELRYDIIIPQGSVPISFLVILVHVSIDHNYVLQI